MSQSSRVDVARAFVERFIAKDFDAIYELVTDDFSYKAEPKPPVELGLGNTDGVLNKAEHKAYCAIIAEGVINFNATIDSATETGDTIILKVTSQFSYIAPDTGMVVTGDAPYNAAYTFSGNKIKFVDSVTNGALIKVLVSEGL